jgi:uncharacterized coiled-coil DUF342 family protein
MPSQSDVIEEDLRAAKQYELDATHAALAAAYSEIDRLKLRIVTYHNKHLSLQKDHRELASKLNRIACVLKGDAR